jgi:broad specificity phosphatase PhoE
MRELILVRHGQSLYNVGLSKDLDSDLTPEGRRQVRETGRFLAQHLGHIRGFIGRASPYLRCLQTARILAEETGVEFWIEDGPREIMTCYGECYIPRRHVEFPEFVWDKYRRNAESAYKQETVEEFNRRTKDYHDHLQSFEKVLVVSHGTTTTTLHKMSLNLYDGVPGVIKGSYVDNSSLSYTRGGSPVWFNKVVYGEGPKEEHQGAEVDGIGPIGVGF